MKTWPWCRSHDAPLIATADGWRCYWEGTPTIDNSEGCRATAIRWEHTGLVFDLSHRGLAPDRLNQ
jgi:hypothetical protein